MQQQQNNDALHVFVTEGLVSTEQVHEAHALAQEQSKKPLQVLIEMGAISQSDAIRVTAKQSGLDFVELIDRSIDRRVTDLLPAAQARRHTVIPFEVTDGNVLRIAVTISKATNIDLKDDLQRITRSRVELVVAVKGDIEAKIAQVYRMEDEIEGLDASAEDTDGDAEDVGLVAEDSPVVKFVDLIISQAIIDRASDIHIEPEEDVTYVRFRIDDVMQDRFTVPKHLRNGVISRLKVMAEMAIDQRRLPQGGRIDYVHNGKKVDLRAQTLPSIHAEGVISRRQESVYNKIMV